MLKIYARREQELKLLPLLAEFRARVIASYPIKGRTRKIKGKNAYKVTNLPIDTTNYNCSNCGEIYSRSALHFMDNGMTLCGLCYNGE